MGGNPRWWEELEEQRDPAEDDWATLSPAEVDDRIEEAASFISVLDDLQPIDPRATNMFMEVWRRIAAIPPAARPRLLGELEPGSVRSLWRASMARYVLPDAAAQQLLGGFSILDDFPSQPGEIATYEGMAEKWEYDAPERRFSVDSDKQAKYPRSAPWLRPNASRLRPNRQPFTQHFFLHPRTGVMHARFVPRLLGPLPDVWTPLYCRVRPDLTLTPLESDAGADMTFDYVPVPQPGDNHATVMRDAPAARLGDASEDSESAPGPLGLNPAQRAAVLAALLPPDLPDQRWPEPVPGMLSPLSQTERDFVRVAGPGVYVGCAYPRDARGTTLKEECIHFVLIRKK